MWTTFNELLISRSENQSNMRVFNLLRTNDNNEINRIYYKQARKILKAKAAH